MADMAIIVAATEPGLLAVADAHQCTLIPDTAYEFDNLGSFADPGLGDVGDIGVGGTGWVALATRN